MGVDIYSEHGSRRSKTALSIKYPHLIMVVLIVLAVLVMSSVAWLPIRELMPGPVRVTVGMVRQFLPQGWAFFTKSPRAELVLPYRLTENGWVLAHRGPAARASAFFGWDRTSRLTEVDLDQIGRHLSEDWWEACGTDEHSSCLNGATVRAITVQKFNFQLCGQIGLVKTDPIPWVYRHHVERMPGSVIRMSVTCKPAGDVQQGGEQ